MSNGDEKIGGSSCYFKEINGENPFEFTAEDEENEILKQIDSINKAYKDDTQNADDCITTLCTYFKENIKNMSKSFKSPKRVRSKNLKQFRVDDTNNDDRLLLVHNSLNMKGNRALSQSCISSISIKELLDKIFLSYDYNDEAKKNTYSINLNSCSTKNSVGSLISQNIEAQEEILKIIFIGSKGVGKTRLINNLLKKDVEEYDENHEFNPTIG